MIINRAASALKSQDWFTVFIEFLLVVLGVLVALEVDRYNERQQERARELDFLSSLQQDIERDIEDIELLVRGFSTVESFGYSAVEILEGTGCPRETCWQTLVELFHASQWLDASLHSATYEEMKRLGLPSDMVLKDVLERYYMLGKQRKLLTSDFPEYRRIVRSLVPPHIQRHIWSNCFTVSGRFETYSTDCTSPTTEDAARLIVEKLRQKSGVLESLTFWLSNLSLTTLTLPLQIEEAREVLDAIRSAVAHD